MQTNNGHLVLNPNDLASRDEIARMVRQIRFLPYQLVTLNLSVAASNMEMNLAGDSIYVLEATDTSANVKVKINEFQNPETTLTKQLGVRSPFYRLFLSWDQQNGKTVTLLVFTSTLYDVIDQRPGAAGGGGGGGVDPVRIHDGTDILLINTDGSALVDPKDRAARLLGIIYGDQGQLTQRATTKDLLIQLRHAGTEIDPRAIQSLPALPAGNNNIGDVDVVSLPALPAGTNNIGDVDVVTLPVDTYSAKSADASSSGDNTIHTPAAGKKIRLYYLALSANGANSADVTTVVKFAAGGATKYKLSLKAGAIWARNIGAGRRYLEGAANEALIVNLSAAQTVHASLEYEEI